MAQPTLWALILLDFFYAPKSHIQLLHLIWKHFQKMQIEYLTLSPQHPETGTFITHLVC